MAINDSDDDKKVCEALGSAKGPEAYGIDHGEYWARHSGLHGMKETWWERLYREMAEMKPLSDEQFAVVKSQIVEKTIESEGGYVRRMAVHPIYMFESIQHEQARRDLAAHANIIKSEIRFKKDGCCDGTMLEFGDIVTVCIAPQNFTEVDELIGDRVAILGSDKPLPKRLTVTLGDAKQNNVGEHTQYYNRNIMPHWFRHFLDTEVEGDPNTVETRKAIWEQMLNAVVKKKDRKNPSAIFLEKPTKKREIKKYLKRTEVEIKEEFSHVESQLRESTNKS